MMMNYLSAIRYFAYIRLFSWPLFFLFMWCCVSISTDVFSALDNRLPWESMFDSLGMVDTLRAIMFPFLFAYTVYLGYRCIVNEFDNGVIEVNRQFNRTLIDNLLNKQGI